MGFKEYGILAIVLFPQVRSICFDAGDLCGQCTRTDQRNMTKGRSMSRSFWYWSIIIYCTCFAHHSSVTYGWVPLGCYNKEDLLTQSQTSCPSALTNRDWKVTSLPRQAALSYCKVLLDGEGSLACSFFLQKRENNLARIQLVTRCRYTKLSLSHTGHRNASAAIF